MVGALPLTGPLRHLHIFRSEDECRADKDKPMGGPRPRCVLRKGPPPTSQQRPGRDARGSGVGTKRPPLSERGEPLVARGELAFYLCPFFPQ